MDTNQMFSFLDILVLGAGCYLFYAWVRLMRKGELTEGLLTQKGSTKICRDIEGYKKFMGWKLLIFALSAIASGALGMYSDYVSHINGILYMGITVVFLIILIWFTYSMKKAEKMFFA